MPRKKTSCHLCPNEIVVAGFCRACYDNVRYWSSKTPAQMVKRMHDLDRYRRRMEFMTGGKIQTTGRKKKKAG